VYVVWNRLSGRWSKIVSNSIWGINLNQDLCMGESFKMLMVAGLVAPIVCPPSPNSYTLTHSEVPDPQLNDILQVHWISSIVLQVEKGLTSLTFLSLPPSPSGKQGACSCAGIHVRLWQASLGENPGYLVSEGPGPLQVPSLSGGGRHAGAEVCIDCLATHISFSIMVFDIIQVRQLPLTPFRFTSEELQFLAHIIQHAEHKCQCVCV